MGKYLDLHVEMGAIHNSGQDERVPLPDDWDQMSESEQAAYADACFESFLESQVSGGWNVVDSDD